MTHKRPQKEKCKQFVVFTGASERVAVEVLKRNDWNLEAAVDSFFGSGGMSSGGGAVDRPPSLGTKPERAPPPP